MRIGEQDPILPAGFAGQRVPHDARHADRLEQGVVELWLRPSGRAVGTRRHETTVLLRPAPHVEHDAAVCQFDHHCLVRVDPFGRARYRDVAAVPVIAGIIAINGRRHARAMGVAASTGREPHRHDQAAALELDAVRGTGRQHLPVELAAEGLECLGDLDRLRPGQAVIVAAEVEAAGILETKDRMHRAGAIGEQRAVVVGHLVVGRQFLLERHGVLLLRARHVSEPVGLAPGPAAVGAAAEQDVDRAPVAAGALAGLAVGEHRSLRRDDDSRDAVEHVSAGLRLENIDLFESGGLGRRHLELREEPLQCFAADFACGR